MKCLRSTLAIKIFHYAGSSEGDVLIDYQTESNYNSTGTYM